MKNLKTYQSVIQTLQSNDRNGTWDEILIDYDNNLEEATRILISCLERIIEDEGYEGEELEFYQSVLEKAKTI